MNTTVLRAALLLVAATPLAAQMKLSDLPGDAAGAHHGASLAVAGDLDQDGYPDLLIGAPDHTHAGLVGAGRVQAISGKTRAVIGTLDGGQAGARFGTAVAGGADLDADGWLDVAIGAPMQTGSVAQEGAVHLVSGQTGLTLLTIFGGKAGAEFGHAVVLVGDVDGDGRSDVAIGAPGYLLGGGSPLGLVQLRSGANGQVLRSWLGTPDSRYGEALAAVGDWDGDGTPDLAIGGPGHDSRRGRVDVVSGATGVTLFVRAGNTIFEDLGSSLASIGDVDGDGQNELVVGAPHESLGQGAAHVLRGGNGNEWLLLHGSLVNGGFGTSVGAAGDVDRDGFGDLLVGEPANGSGTAQIFSGATGALLWVPAWVVGSQSFGTTVTGLGDIDGDGWDEFAVGAPTFTAGGLFESGSVHIWRAAVAQTDLGFTGPGDTRLEIYGMPLATGHSADLFVSQAPPAAICYLAISPAQHLLAFKGGTVVPDLDLGFLVQLSTDFGGKLQAPGIPGGFGPVDFYLQLFTKDASLPQGIDFSNALRCSFLP